MNVMLLKSALTAYAAVGFNDIPETGKGLSYNVSKSSWLKYTPLVLQRVYDPTKIKKDHFL
jgi:hypothetical protein